ncbi:MAG: ribonuclease P protein component [Deltaproteobacteria bacterium]|nr:ribonuclease P protein component [Deltaproteobacteria bacterium]MBI3390661.1 ribonuclease P protein component [Deltaproteobacteria bacterium]
MPRRWRIRNRREYVWLQRDGRRRSTLHFIVLWRGRTDGVSRLGLTVSRKVGGAVIRNRVKRRVREWFRRQRLQLVQARDFVVIARPSAAILSAAEIAVELTQAGRAS